MFRRINVSRRACITTCVAGLTAALFGGLGIRPRFRGRWCVARSAKQIQGSSASDRHRFARPGAVCCLVLGDWGSGLPLQREVAEGMQQFASVEHPQFIISTGDNFYPSGVESIDDPAWRDKFENVYNGHDLRLPWYSTLGNHDHQGAIDPQIEYGRVNPRWNMPAPWYAFTRTCGDVRVDFFTLDTESFAVGDMPQMSQQIAWLDSALAKSTADWKLCVGHHPLRSHGHYGSTPRLVEFVKPLLDRHGVAAYVCGHDHDLQLVKADDDRFCCVVSGAGGKARDALIGDDTVFADTNGGFAALSFTKTEMGVAFVDADGSPSWIERFLKWPTMGAAENEEEFICQRQSLLASENQSSSSLPIGQS
ncbi:MAG TPA: tartrate-resistant acid phosphatase type 5 family protein [Caulifigura sp.]|jgi:acid phosphatase|nr:tartrate-resistant acid phosphatase type 5 family protein [Caulifigura sp.]